MKVFRKLFIVSFLILLLIYVTNITSIPNNIVLIQGEKMNIGAVYGVSLIEKGDFENEYTVQTASTLQADSREVGKVDYKLSLFGKIPLKDISVSVIPKTSVVPLGNTVGLKLYTSGVLVVGMSEIEGSDNKKYKPYENTGIEEGDMIIKVGENSVTCTAELLNNIDASRWRKYTDSLCSRWRKHTNFYNTSKG